MNAFWFPLVTIGLTLVIQPVQGAESAWIDTGKAQVRLHADAARAAVEIRMLPNWHTYWRFPGDAGVPPHFDWSGSQNLAGTTVRFPPPQRIREAAGQIIGYKDRVLFPIELKAADPKKPIRLRLKFDFAVCEKICIPVEAKFDLDIAPDEQASAVIEAAQALLPVRDRPGSGKELSIQSVKLERGAKPVIRVEVLAPQGQDIDLFAEGPSEDWFLPLPERESRQGGRAAYVIPVDGAPPGAPPVPQSIRLTLVSGGKAIEADVALD